MRRMLFAALIAIAPLAACSKSDDKKSDDKAEHAKLPEMTVEQVAADVEAKKITLVDCNGEKTRKKHGILPGAILIDDEETFTESALPTDKATKLLFYCGGPG